ncbi:glycosyltransferase family 2 protein [Primorskyibacter sp. 2E107]|uniref:glycosyltransferase family 2 protein n=1 Tax=Primorskyibacter sp. 2E107 TaxID=3403458 RepID=UPI003AF4ED5C
MHTLPVSVILVSRARPQALARCLLGLSQLDYPNFEVVVVACPAGIAAAQQVDQAEHLKRVAFDEANISAARNAGITEAAGEIVAFIDDDAVPEPLWLHHLVAPFDQPEVAASGGYVIGRNGISFQWKARMVDETGEATEIVLDGDAPTAPTADLGKAIKTEGTNMAVRRSVLAGIGGFDPGFRFYLDETDLNMRLAQAGKQTVIVPLAQVHHGFAESDRRHADRSPRDLTEIGASKMLFLRKHTPEKARKAAWEAFRKAQRLRLLRLMQSGPFGADDVWRLMRGLDRGAKDGAQRPVGPLPPLAEAETAFRPFPGRPDAPRLAIAGRIWQAGKLRAKAEISVRKGAVTSLFLFSPTARFHRVAFSETGVWEQTGGLFGRSDRHTSFVRVTRFSRRLKEEIRRISQVRGNFTQQSHKN